MKEQICETIFDWYKEVKILFISYYYYPDLSAGSFRVKAMVDYLSSISKKK